MLKIYQNRRFRIGYPIIENVKIEGFVTCFYGASAIETLSFYKLSLYTEDFKLLGFPPRKGCPISPYGGQGGLTILRLMGHPWLEILFFLTRFPIYWGLLSFYMLSSLYLDFVFLLIPPCIEDFAFVQFHPCAEDFAFYDISHLLETLSFYKLSLYTENFELLGFSRCIRDFVF